MRAVVKSVEGIGREEPDGYVPVDPWDDAFTLRLMVGLPDTPGMESFDVLVCTPAWLAREVTEHGPQVGRHMLIVEKLDLAKAQEFLRRRIEQLDEPTYPELAAKVARLGYWEFEDYKDRPGTGT